jgi:hypothetical protein
MQNIELKARLRDFSAAEAICGELGARSCGDIH